MILFYNRESFNKWYQQEEARERLLTDDTQKLRDKLVYNNLNNPELR
ncbi:MAG: hypothetical protein AAF098_06235 [Pseudomonadota bacterium]